MSKNSELKTLDELAEKLIEKEGTLNTQIFAQDWTVRTQILNCYRMGATRQEVEAILSKYATK